MFPVLRSKSYNNATECIREIRYKVLCFTQKADCQITLVNDSERDNDSGRDSLSRHCFRAYKLAYH